MEEVEVLKAVNMRGIKLKNVEEFEKRRAEECKYGFSPDNFTINFGEDGVVKGGSVEKLMNKWLDKQLFLSLLSKHLIEGRAGFVFFDEELDKTTFTVLPEVVLPNKLKEFTPSELLTTLDNENIPYNKQVKVIELYLYELIEKQKEINRDIEETKNYLLSRKELANFNPTKVES